MINDAKGGGVRMIGTLRDITGRKRADDALRESEERYRRIFESFEDLYYQTDTSGIITLLSPSLHRLTGYKEEELIGKPVTGIYVNPETRAALLDEIAKNGHVRDYEVNLRKRDGTEVLVSMSANRIYNTDGTPAGIAGILRDISRRKRAEEALRESEEKFRSLVEYALEAICILDLQGKILFANNAAARTLETDDYPHLIGRNVMEFIAPGSRDAVIRDFAQVAQGHDGYLAHYHVITEKGNTISVESIGKVITYEGKTADPSRSGILPAKSAGSRGVQGGKNNSGRWSKPPATGSGPPILKESIPTAIPRSWICWDTGSARSWARTPFP